MQEAVVLFVHHRNDGITQFHRNLLRMHNRFPIVPLFCDDGMGGVPLDDAVHVPMTYRRGRNWHNMDWICREWYRSVQRINAHRYIWLEWDCHVNVPLMHWYGEDWKRDLVGSFAITSDQDWYWFQSQKDFLPHNLHRFARGVSPMNGVLLSRHAMETYAAEDLPEGIFCELRLATVLAARGVVAESLAPHRSQTNVFLPDGKSIEVKGNGLFHPIKSIVS